MRFDGTRIVAALAVTAAVIAGTSPGSAQSGVQVDVTAGAMTIFGNTGPYGAVAAFPLRLSAAQHSQLRLGLGTWIGTAGTSLSTPHRRVVVGVGPVLELEHQLSRGGLAVFARTEGYWLHSSVDDSPSIPGSGSNRSVLDRPGSTTGVGLGASAGLGLKLSRSIGLRMGVGYLHHAIYKGHSGGLWRFGVGVTVR